MQLKKFSVLLASLSVSFFCNFASADFKKALDAYIHRDGLALLKNVQHAVHAKNCDGLMLFLMATNMDAATSEYDPSKFQYKSTLRRILTAKQWLSLKGLLANSAKYSTPQAQYLLKLNSQFSRELMVDYINQQKGISESSDIEYSNQEINQAYAKVREQFHKYGLGLTATSLSNVIKLADSGNPYYESLLGTLYLGEVLEPNLHYCENSMYKPVCQKKDKEKAFHWLKKAVVSYYKSGLLNEELGKFSTNVCNILYHYSSNKRQRLNQAYLWCLKGANLGDDESIFLLEKMYLAGDLVKLSPSLEKSWKTQKRNDLIFQTKTLQEPDWVIEAKSLVNHNSLPILSVLFEGKTRYGLDIYVDGRVYIKDLQKTGFKALLQRASKQKINQFIKSLNQIGIDDWPLYSGVGYPGESIGATPLKELRLTLRGNDQTRRLHLSGTRNKSENVSQTNLKISKVMALVNSCFPTNQLRYELGNSIEIKQKIFAEEQK